MKKVIVILPVLVVISLVMSISIPLLNAASATKLIPVKIISKNKPVYSNVNGASAGVDGDYGTSWGAGSKPSGTAPKWIAIDIGTGYKKVALDWHVTGYGYGLTAEGDSYGHPMNCTIEVSADSSNGSDGTWKTVATIENNDSHERESGFDFTGMRWAKLVVTQLPKRNTNGLNIAEIQIHDLSDTSGTQDTWAIMGDSIEAFVFREMYKPMLADLVHQRYENYDPMIIDCSMPGYTTGTYLEILDKVLERNKDANICAIALGTNDCWGNGVPDTTAFKANLSQMIKKLQAAGKVVVLAKIPWAVNHTSIPAFNDAIDEITKTYNVYPGPDFYKVLYNHPEYLSDGVHPNPAGCKVMTEEWMRAINDFYQGGVPVNTNTPVAPTNKPSFLPTQAPTNYPIPSPTGKTEEKVLYNGESVPYGAGTGWDGNGSSIKETNTSPKSPTNHIQASIKVANWWGAVAYNPQKNFDSMDFSTTKALEFSAKANEAVTLTLQLCNTKTQTKSESPTIPLTQSYQEFTIPMSSFKNASMDLTQVNAMVLAVSVAGSPTYTVDVDDIMIIGDATDDKTHPTPSIKPTDMVTPSPLPTIHPTDYPTSTPPVPTLDPTENPIPSATPSISPVVSPKPDGDKSKDRKELIKLLEQLIKIMNKWFGS